MKEDKTVFFKKSKSLPFIEMRKASQSNACYHSHSHNEFSFGVIDSGVADYINLNQKVRITPGDTVTINPGDIHSCNPESTDWSYRMLFVDTDWVGNLQSEMAGTSNKDYQTFCNTFETSRKYFNDFSYLFTSLLNDENPLELEVQLIHFLENTFMKDKIPETRIKVETQVLRKISEKLLDELNINHSLDSLSSESGLSRYHLIRSFKQVYGLSPHALQLDERIKKAKLLLKSGHSILDTSTLLGFSDQSHFQRNFKKRLALTPKQYQTFFT